MPAPDADIAKGESLRCEESIEFCDGERLSCPAGTDKTVSRLAIRRARRDPQACGTAADKHKPNIQEK